MLVDTIVAYIRIISRSLLLPVVFVACAGVAVAKNTPTSTSNTFNTADLQITLDIAASPASPNNIHTYQRVFDANGGTLTGILTAGGRNFDPTVVVGTSPATTSLNSFVGDDPTQEWTLLLADVDYGEQGNLANWGLVVTAVPEPGTLGLLALGLGGLAGTRWLRRR